jgi:hypothetical protein
MLVKIILGGYYFSVTIALVSAYVATIASHYQPLGNPRYYLLSVICR